MERHTDAAHARFPLDPLAFYGWGESMSATWDVWSAMHTDAKGVHDLAEQRLRGLIAGARERCPFYRKLYWGLRTDRCRLADLPVVTKRDLMAHFAAAVADRAVTAARVQDFLADKGGAGQPFLDRYAVWTSSGTTEEPGIFLHDRRALAVYEALHALRFRQLGLADLVAAAFLAGDRYAMIGATGGHFAGHATIERLRALNPWLADRVRMFSILEPLPALTRQLNAYQPTLLASYPTATALLAECQLAGDLAIRPREIWTGGEQLSSAQRVQIASAFTCPVRDDYGASEFMAIAWDCGHGALHVNADWALLEPVDERYRPVPPGVPSYTALLTNLANRIQPLIRYDLGDSITLLDGPCACGSTLPAIRIAGRCDDIVVLADASGRSVKLAPLALTTVLEDEAGVYRFQLFRVSATHLVLHLDPEIGDADAVRRCHEALGRFLCAHGISNVRVDVRKRTLQRHPVSGKLQRVMARKP